MTITIDRRPVPLPGTTDKPAPRRRYPFARLSPGQSFVVRGSYREQRAAISAAVHWGRRNGARFVWKRYRFSVRIWRLAPEPPPRLADKA